MDAPSASVAPSIAFASTTSHSDIDHFQTTQEGGTFAFPGSALASIIQ